MVKSELIRIISKKSPGLTLYQAERVVDVFFEQLSDTLINGGRIELRGFGVFFGKLRKARKGLNPRTGEQLYVQPKMVPYFRLSKLLLNTINEAQIEI